MARPLLGGRAFAREEVAMRRMIGPFLGLLMAAILTAAPPVAASAALKVSGTYSTSQFFVDGVQQDGLSLHLTGHGTSAWSGSFVGTTTFAGSAVVNLTNGTTRGTLTEVFTGSVAGLGSGTISFREPFFISAGGTLRLEYVITGASGALAGVLGAGVFVGTSAPDGSGSGTYSGTLVP
jgi:hypothetical protein